MLQILALILGLCSWGILIWGIIKREKYTKNDMYELYFRSWFCCAGALYIPSLCQFFEFKTEDYDGLIDCTVTYHLLSTILLFITIILTILSIQLQKKA